MLLQIILFYYFGDDSFRLLGGQTPVHHVSHFRRESTCCHLLKYHRSAVCPWNYSVGKDGWKSVISALEVAIRALFGL